ncbi:uncharacterized protein LOC141639076 isoform X2 [Silene latifolia]|uniref:uncharacterized protein LOC141639076 isoform X2 n=1 Tax=Silene latifolia TaxID=37657 RepID=UPI003D78969F
MGSSGEKQGVKLDRSVSSAGSSALPPAKSTKIKDRPHVRKPFKLYQNKNCRHNRNRPVFPTKSTTLSLKLKSSSETCYSWCSTCSTCSTGRSKRSNSGEELEDEFGDSYIVEDSG